MGFNQKRLLIDAGRFGDLNSDMVILYEWVVVKLVYLIRLVQIFIINLSAILVFLGRLGYYLRIENLYEWVVVNMVYSIILLYNFIKI